MWLSWFGFLLREVVIVVVDTVAAVVIVDVIGVAIAVCVCGYQKDLLCFCNSWIFLISI